MTTSIFIITHSSEFHTRLITIECHSPFLDIVLTSLATWDLTKTHTQHQLYFASGEYSEIMLLITLHNYVLSICLIILNSPWNLDTTVCNGLFQPENFNTIWKNDLTQCYNYNICFFVHRPPSKNFSFLQALYICHNYSISNLFLG